MSYDIVAFDPDAAPSDPEMAMWWVEQTEAEQPSYSDPAITTAPLQAFYPDIIKDFPPLSDFSGR